MWGTAGHVDQHLEAEITQTPLNPVFIKKGRSGEERGKNLRRLGEETAVSSASHVPAEDFVFTFGVEARMLAPTHGEELHSSG